jgi:hypothetical protein
MESITVDLVDRITWVDHLQLTCCETREDEPARREPNGAMEAIEQITEATS